MKIETLICGALEENAYIISLEGRDDCAVIDPGDDGEALLSAVSGRIIIISASDAICRKTAFSLSLQTTIFDPRCPIIKSKKS